MTSAHFCSGWPNNLAIDLFRRRGTRERQHDLFAAEAVSHFAPAADSGRSRLFGSG